MNASSSKGGPPGTFLTRAKISYAYASRWMGFILDVTRGSVGNFILFRHISTLQSVRKFEKQPIVTPSTKFPHPSIGMHQLKHFYILVRHFKIPAICGHLNSSVLVSRASIFAIAGPRRFAGSRDVDGLA